MDGYELCRRIKADQRVRDIPVMLLTTLAVPDDVICGLACGADNFAVRPLVEEMVIARIRTVLANRVLPENSSAITVHFAGQQYVITSDRRQILNLLLSAYETAVQTNRELRRTRDLLQAVEARLAEAERSAKPEATPSSQARSS
jgi:DNA-binding response OmpR family regulator